MKKNKWFSNNKGHGYIEYKENGEVSIYWFVNRTLIKIELKNED